MSEACPYCSVKHALSARTYLLEAASSGAALPLNILENLDGIIKDIDNFILKNKIKPIS
jgi:hypothetical protein